MKQSGGVLLVKEVQGQEEVEAEKWRRGEFHKHLSYTQEKKPGTK